MEASTQVSHAEGWATYTEMQSFYYAGLDPDLASLLQHNQAATLSLYATADIGIHYFGWEKEKIAAFWSEYGVDDTATVKRITDLILEEPGNYLKYYVGYLKFRQMRRPGKPGERRCIFSGFPCGQPFLFVDSSVTRFYNKFL